LLYPDKKYHKNLMWENIVFHFEGNRCGDLELTSAWSVEDVMQLYRAEYRHSADTLLYVDGGGESNGKRMAIHPAYAANSSTGTTDRRLAPRFYGAILPGEQLTGDENFWLPATPIMFHETLQWEVH
ncbi:MAG: hypothetical protein LBL94_00785, partial [Prevotellaceae bacterium]|nr:hypothetical protein [Prevotellaceae bacterium]